MHKGATLTATIPMYGSFDCYASASSPFEMDMHISGWATDLNNGTVWLEGRQDWTYRYQVTAHDGAGFRWMHADYELWSDTGYSYNTLIHEETNPFL